MKYKKTRILHYGGLSPSIPQGNYSKERKQLEIFNKILKELGFTQITTKPSQYIVHNTKYPCITPTPFPILKDFDLVIINDSPQCCVDFDVLRNFIENEVKDKGKTLMLIAGYGLGKSYNSELKSYLGGEVGKRFPDHLKLKSKRYSEESIRKSKELVDKLRESIEIENGPGKGLRFKGFVIFKPYDVKEVLWNFKVENISLHNKEPAFIVHRVGRGNLVIFTSCCHKDWGKYAMTQPTFTDVWRELFIML